MSQENLDLLRRGYEHVERTGAFPPEAAHPDFVWDATTFRGGMLPETCVGVDETNAWLAEWLEGFEHWSLDIEEVFDLAALDPDVVYEDANLPDHIGETYRGPEGILRAAERWADASETLTLELVRIVGSGDRFVSVHQSHSKARHSGMEFDGPLAYAWTFRDGRIVHLQSYRDPAEALEAAGLRE
jgi:ketosteroid isomerase-like protein